MQLRQSLKMIKLGYILCAVAELAAIGYWAALKPDFPAWVPMLIPVLLAAFVAIRHLKRRMTSITIEGDRLRFESGLFAKSTRTVELAKLQDVRVDQSVGQRLIGVGDISMETAGGSSRIVMASIDRPRESADKILDLARGSAK